MSCLRRYWSSSFLALALVFAIGQQAVLLHDLSHAFERVRTDSQDQQPHSDHCDKCSAFAQLAGAAPAFVSVVALPAAAPVAPRVSSTPAQSRTVIHALSRAPPAAL
jgi:hypothetical protein